MKRLAFTGAVLLIVSSGSAQEHAPRKCVAFFVGIEKYQEPALQKLKYVGEDVYAVWSRLEAITNLDKSRSKLIVVDREPTGHLPTGDALRLELPYQQLTKEFDHFLLRVKPGDLVVIYLQGHGDIKRRAPQAGVHLLTPEFKPLDDTFEGAVQINHLLRRIGEEFGQPPTNETVFFANMCHAGAAGAMGGEAVTAADIKNAYQTVKLGSKLAYIPASAGSEETFEREEFRRSEYAEHLIAALAGGAADNVGSIKTDGILQYLRDKLSTNPPELPNFDKNIELGRSLGAEAQVRRFLGWTLMAIALDHAEPARTNLLRLAEAHFARCGEIHAAGQASYFLSQLQCRLLVGRTVQDLLSASPSVRADSIIPEERIHAKL